MKKITKTIFSRLAVVVLMLLIQFSLLIFFMWKLTDYFVYLYGVLVALSVVIIVYLSSKKDNPAYKLAWTIPILLFPVFGGVLYLMFGKRQSSKSLLHKMDVAVKYTESMLETDENVTQKLLGLDRNAWCQSEYIAKYAGFPAYCDTTTEYLPLGEIKFKRLKEELEKAQHFIFLEYFIIDEGVMWGEVLEILERKVAEGLEVRVMYDDAGCMGLIPYNYANILRKKGIKSAVFNPFNPYLSTQLNNRDHRKIAVIDGHTGFTGGINLADEYINAYPKHGHWKDASIMLKGNGVWNLTVMFFQLWNVATGEIDSYEQYRPRIHHAESFESDGFVQPYGDSPTDGENVGEMVYLNMIGRAKDYIYINTPYLIIDNELMTALSLAAKSGVDVRIVTPHHGDKWFVFMVTQSYYLQLIQAGVKIYEYTPGFIHAKTFVCDDLYATVGTVNLDFRSLYLHYECGVWMYKTRSVASVKRDFLETLNVCQRITAEECRKVPLWKRVLRSILKLFAPLM
ncbi:cardiolipin synthase [Candidatus Soleaferrea massiliensis]|uniref:cardiolipin synthase n=1 Tax=Candidatus Soleaferrea massiliensis TaxID=1470354 RepID=UPI0009E4A8EC|nr:cardiolipin synthase [Candidatus Soleaferrea massiliensis]